MIMEITAREKGSLIEFLDMSLKNGYAKKGTLLNRLRIVKDIFATVPNLDNADVTMLDIGQVYSQYVNLKKPIMSGPTVKGNAAHFSSAIKEFKLWVNNPSGYPPMKAKTTSVSSIKSVKNRISDKIPSKTSEKTIDTSSIPINNISKQNSSVPSIHIDFQIHISPDTNPEVFEKLFASLSKYYPSK